MWLSAVTFVIKAIHIDLHYLIEKVMALLFTMQKGGVVYLCGLVNLFVARLLKINRQMFFLSL